MRMIELPFSRRASRSVARQISSTAVSAVTFRRKIDTGFARVVSDTEMLTPVWSAMSRISVPSGTASLSR